MPDALTPGIERQSPTTKEVTHDHYNTFPAGVKCLAGLAMKSARVVDLTTKIANMAASIQPAGVQHPYCLTAHGTATNAGMYGIFPSARVL